MTATVPPETTSPGTALSSQRLLVGGQVQGVGFRPFIYRLAHQHRLSGWVRNELGRVHIEVQGAPTAIEEFRHDLIAHAPAIARPQIMETLPGSDERHREFRILSSEGGAEPDIHIPPDYFTCPDCLQELNDPTDRRYRYPFINCTQCGPRYTLIRRLPYDRPNTTMAGFPLCSECQAEYENPLNRRFHAEPLACPVCGPQLRFAVNGNTLTQKTEEALQRCIEALRDGLIVAVKGIGGYHLMCDARSEASVQRLRRHKARPWKPLAILVPTGGEDELDHARALAELTAQEAALLRNPIRPIVLARKRAHTPLAAGISPELAEIGLMLPYSPLHHILVNDFGAPLVATSGNISGEPVLTEEGDAEQRLGAIAEAFLHHNRPIQRPADDSVWRTSAGAPRPLRLGRGSSPKELKLPVQLSRPLLAVGAHLKNTITLAWNDRAVISPHIGDLGSPRSLTVFEQVVEELQALFDVRAEQIICDAHPQYQNSRWAEQSGLPVTRVFHHHAHASAIHGEHALPGPALVFTWDGTGLGADGAIWGGEALYGQPGAWRRVGSLRPFRLPGGDRAAREPWRSALSLCWETDHHWDLSPHDSPLLRQAWERGQNCPTTTACGRLFDAAAALAGLVTQNSFEGQAAMWLEAHALHQASPVELPLQRNREGIWVSDWAPLLPVLMDPQQGIELRASRFHASLAHALLQQALRVREEHGVTQVGLSGGVFQNRVLAEQAQCLLQEHGFSVWLAEQIPCNDAGISFGQIIEAGARQDE